MEFALYPSNLTSEEALAIIERHRYSTPDELIVIEEGEHALDIIMELLADEEEGFIEDAHFLILTPPVDTVGFNDAPFDLDYNHIFID